MENNKPHTDNSQTANSPTPLTFPDGLFGLRVMDAALAPFFRPGAVLFVLPLTEPVAAPSLLLENGLRLPFAHPRLPHGGIVKGVYWGDCAGGDTDGGEEEGDDTPARPNPAWVVGACPECGDALVDTPYYEGGKHFLRRECWNSLGSHPTCQHRETARPSRC